MFFFFFVDAKVKLANVSAAPADEPFPILHKKALIVWNSVNVFLNNTTLKKGSGICDMLLPGCKSWKERKVF